jgi:hypothetical protein
VEFSLKLSLRVPVKLYHLCVAGVCGGVWVCGVLCGCVKNARWDPADNINLIICVENSSALFVCSSQRDKALEFS